MNVFKRLRKEAGLTQSQVAELMGKHRQAISRVECGHRPGFDFIDAFCDALNIPTLEILKEMSNKKKQKGCISEK